MGSSHGSKRTASIGLSVGGGVESGIAGAMPNFQEIIGQSAQFFNKRILIVDDAALNRKLVNRLLRDKIANRDEAVNGRQACEMVAAAHAEGKPYDVIMMDYFMPEMDGPTAVKEMRSRGFVGIIVGVTGNAHASDIATFTLAGANEVMIKPLDADEFWDTVCGTFSFCRMFVCIPVY